MFAKYRKDSAESGAKFVDGAPIMTSRDLSYICRRCLADKEYELRCFFLMDKFGVGRCTEGTTLLWSNFKEYSEDEEDAQCPCIEWFRSKTVTTDDLCLMPDPKNFETCVIHAIASHACMHASHARTRKHQLRFIPRICTLEIHSLYYINTNNSLQL